jgi:hypothetical protein
VRAFVNFEVELGVEVAKVELKFLCFLLVFGLELGLSDISSWVVECFFDGVLLHAFVVAENIHPAI